MYVHTQGSVQEKSPEEKALPVKPQDLLSPIPVTPLLIKPGTGEWIYVDEPLPKVPSGLKVLDIKVYTYLYVLCIFYLNFFSQHIIFLNILQ